MNHLLKITAMVIRFLENCRSPIKKKSEIDAEEKEVALKNYIREIQKEHFDVEIEALTGKKMSIHHAPTAMKREVRTCYDTNRDKKSNSATKKCDGVSDSPSSPLLPPPSTRRSLPTKVLSPQ